MPLSMQQKLFQHIDNHLQSYLKGWEHCYDESSLFDSLREHMQSYGLEIEHDNNHSVLRARLHTDAARTLLLYHRFSPADKFSMASIGAALAAIDAYQQVIGPLPVNLHWLCIYKAKEPIDVVLEQLRDQADGCLYHVSLSDPFFQAVGRRDRTWPAQVMPEMPAESVCIEAPILALGTKGILCVELEVETDHYQSFSSAMGGVVPDAAWRLLWALTSLKSVREDILIEGFYDTVITPENRAIEAFAHLPEEPFAGHLEGLRGFQLYYAWLLTPTCTVSGIQSGGGDRGSDDLSATLPTQARAFIDFHLVPEQDPLDIFANLQQHLQVQGFSDVQLRLLHSRRPVSSTLADPFVQIVQHATNIAYGSNPIWLPLTSTSYPIAPLRQGMPTVLNIDNALLSEYSGAESDLSIQDFAARIKQVAMVIKEMSSWN